MENNIFTSKPEKYKCMIQCPHCGAEYLFEEIFMSDDIIGNRHAVKDEKGRTSLVAQWLRLYASDEGTTFSSPGPRTRIPHAT